MAFYNKDIRLVKGDVEAVTEALADNLNDAGFEVNSGSSTGLVALSKRRSVIGLYLSASPQIACFRIDKESDDRVKVELTYGLFSRFRIFYYSALSALLTLFLVLLKLSDVGAGASSADVFIHSLFITFAGIGCLITAIFFMCRVLDTGPYESFVEKVFSGFSGVVVLRTSSGFPDLWAAVAVFASFILVFIFTTDFISVIPEMIGSGYFFLTGVYAILALLILLLIIMFFKVVAVTRLLFCLVGLALCLPLIILANAPAANVLVTEIVEKVEIIMDDYEKRVEDVSASEKEIRELTAKLKQTKKAGVLLISCFWIGYLLVVLFLLWNALRLPVIITRQLEKFHSKHQDSIYHQALKPEKRSLLFDAVVLLLWAVMSVANLAGLYFSLFIFERVVLGENYLLSTGLGESFFENTKTIFSLGLQETYGIKTTLFFHGATMLVFSLPLTLIFFFVLAKNFIAFVKTVFLLKPSKEFSEIEKELTEMVAEICMDAGIKIPIVRVTDSPYISAETRYLGFPFFKNIMTVSKGAWQELHDNEGMLYGLLAHEVWHQKKHTLLRRVLNTLSDYTLFGNGFLALLQNSYQVEREADAFSMDCLSKKLEGREKAVEIFSSLLKRQRSNEAALNVKKALFANGALSFADTKDDEKRKKLLESFDASSKIKKLWINFYLLFQIYFGEGISSYFHPSVEEREEWVKE